MLARLLRALVPRWYAVGIALLAPVVFLPGAALTVALGTEGTEAEMLVFMGAAFCAVPPSVVLILAGVFAGRAAPRALLFDLALAVAAAGAVVGLLAFTAHPEAWAAGAFLTVMIFGGPVILAGAGGLAFTPAGVAELMDLVREAREEAATALLWSEEKLRLDDLAERSGLSVEDAVALAARAVEEGWLPSRLEPEHGWVWHREYVEQRLEELGSLVAGEGEVRVAEVAHRLEVPDQVVRRWAYEAVHRGSLTGYANWREGVLYSGDASLLGESTACPSCAGFLRPRGGGVARCRHCGTELMLGAA